MSKNNTTKNLFDVIIVATMSTGKSTVINALIGKELLYSANEATTATITRIHDQDDLPYFSGNAYAYDGSLFDESHQIDADTLRKWNADPKIKTIDLAGDIKALQNDAMDIVLYDTPGPNNSQDENHEKLTMEVINNGHYGLILYVLNATQLGVQDDRNLLEDIFSSLSKHEDKEIIFLLNKADMLDPEKDEHIGKAIKNAENYLTEIGFKDPTIIPTTANQALACQKALENENLTRTQVRYLILSLDLNKDFIKFAKIAKKLKSKVKSKLTTINRQKKKDVITVRDFQIKKDKIYDSYLKSGFGIVSLILQQKLSNTKSKPKRN